MLFKTLPHCLNSPHLPTHTHTHTRFPHLFPDTIALVFSVPECDAADRGEQKCQEQADT